MNWLIITATPFAIHKICLKDPSILANSLKSFKICDRAYFCIILWHLVYHLLYFLATYKLNTNIHHYTLSTCTPTVVHTKSSLHSSNNPKSLPVCVKKTLIVLGFILHRTDITSSLGITCQRLVHVWLGNSIRRWLQGFILWRTAFGIREGTRDKISRRSFR